MTLFEKWLKFHSANPDIYRLFVKYTKEALGANYDKYSARTIIHRIRWHVLIDTRSEDGFKINNNHSPYYARLFMHDFPHNTGVFELRKTQDTDMGDWLTSRDFNATYHLRIREG
jgi:hypothetical protein